MERLRVPGAGSQGVGGHFLPPSQTLQPLTPMAAGRPGVAGQCCPLSLAPHHPSLPPGGKGLAWVLPRVGTRSIPLPGLCWGARSSPLLVQGGGGGCLAGREGGREGGGGCGCGAAGEEEEEAGEVRAAGSGQQ